MSKNNGTGKKILLALAALALVGAGVGATVGIQKIQQAVKKSSSDGAEDTSQKATSSAAGTSTAKLSLSIIKFQAENTTDYKSITATISPESATIKTITWSVSDSACIGLSATDGGATSSSITSESGTAIYFKALKGFSGKVNIVSASAFNKTLTATCEVTYTSAYVSAVKWLGINPYAVSGYTKESSYSDGSGHSAKWYSLTDTADTTAAWASGTVEVCTPITLVFHITQADQSGNSAPWFTSLTSEQKAGTAELPYAKANASNSYTVKYDSESVSSGGNEFGFSVAFTTVAADDTITLSDPMGSFLKISVKKQSYLTDIKAMKWEGIREASTSGYSKESYSTDGSGHGAKWYSLTDTTDANSSAAKATVEIIGPYSLAFHITEANASGDRAGWFTSLSSEQKAGTASLPYSTSGSSNSYAVTYLGESTSSDGNEFSFKVAFNTVAANDTLSLTDNGTPFVTINVVKGTTVSGITGSASTETL